VPFASFLTKNVSFTLTTHVDQKQGLMSVRYGVRFHMEHRQVGFKIDLAACQ
jgi:hypothetical protein